MNLKSFEALLNMVLRTWKLALVDLCIKKIEKREAKRSKSSFPFPNIPSNQSSSPWETNQGEFEGGMSNLFWKRSSKQSSLAIFAGWIQKFRDRKKIKNYWIFYNSSFKPNYYKSWKPRGLSKQLCKVYCKICSCCCGYIDERFRVGKHPGRRAPEV